MIDLARYRHLTDDSEWPIHWPPDAPEFLVHAYHGKTIPMAWFGDKSIVDVVYDFATDQLLPVVHSTSHLPKHPVRSITA